MDVVVSFIVYWFHKWKKLIWNLNFKSFVSGFLSLKKIEPDIRLSRLKFDDIWAGTYGSFVKVAGSTDIYVFGLNNYCQMGKSVLLY